MKKRLGTFTLAWLAAMLALLYIAGGAFAAPSSSPYTDSASMALKWIATQQSPDGSFAGFGAGSTVDAVLSIVAAGDRADAFAHGYNAAAFLQNNAGAIAKTAGGAGKLLIAVSALGQNGKSFGGVDLVGAINATYGISATGQYGPDALGHAFAILGLHAAGEPLPAEAVTQLESLQASDGGWAFTGDTTPGAADTNTTAVAVQASDRCRRNRKQPSIKRPHISRASKTPMAAGLTRRAALLAARATSTPPPTWSRPCSP